MYQALPQCKLTNCTKKVWVEVNGRQHDYCGTTHADLAGKLKKKKICKLAGCGKEVHGTFDFCKRGHGRQYEAMQSGVASAAASHSASAPPTMTLPAPRTSCPAKGYYYNKGNNFSVNGHTYSPDLNAVPFYLDAVDASTGFLGNFHPCPLGVVTTWGKFTNGEAAYQAAKFKHHANYHSFYRPLFEKASAQEAFDLSRQHKSKALHWQAFNGIKDQVMLEVVRSKFNRDTQLKIQLKNTGKIYLIEKLPEHRDDPGALDWGWNSAHGGKNKLGAILMQVRDEL